MFKYIILLLIFIYSFSFSQEFNITDENMLYLEANATLSVEPLTAEDTLIEISGKLSNVNTWLSRLQRQSLSQLQSIDTNLVPTLIHVDEDLHSINNLIDNLLITTQTIQGDVSSMIYNGLEVHGEVSVDGLSEVASNVAEIKNYISEDEIQDGELQDFTSSFFYDIEDIQPIANYIYEQSLETNEWDLTEPDEYFYDYYDLTNEVAISSSILESDTLKYQMNELSNTLSTATNPFKNFVSSKIDNINEFTSHEYSSFINLDICGENLSLDLSRYVKINQRAMQIIWTFLTGVSTLATIIYLVKFFWEAY